MLAQGWYRAAIGVHQGVLRDDYLVKQLRLLLERVARALGLLDEGRAAEAGDLAEQTIEELVSGCGPDWEQLATPTLLSMLGPPERGRALARALWIASTVDEAAGRYVQAHRRCRRAMELYARLRLGSESEDVRAARALAASSARLREHINR